MQTSGFQTTEQRKPPPPPRKARSDKGVPRGELMGTVEKRAAAEGFTLVSTRQQGGDLTGQQKLAFKKQGAAEQEAAEEPEIKAGTFV